MQSDICIITPAKDCSYIDDMEANMAVAINNCFTDTNVFRISNSVANDELPLLSYSYTHKKWLTGRYIGKLYFEYNGKHHCFEVKPRFGTASVLMLLEEIFNIKLAQSNSNHKLHDDSHNELLKKIISIIWIKILSKANVHGLPKQRIEKLSKSSIVRGKIAIKQSILPIYNERCVVSKRIEKEIDSTIVTILKKAYTILCKDYYLTENMLSDAVKEVVRVPGHNQQIITSNQFQKIKYGAIYANYKEIVDFSWHIIQHKKKSTTQKMVDTIGDALFLDMAEIWEKYLFAILKKHFTPSGWDVYSQQYKIYQNTDFRRSIIPDIILEKDSQVIVLDAKYKRMTGNFRDYDRADFFQLHTYGSYMQSYNKKVIGLGLVYPLSDSFDKEKLNSNFANYLYGDSTSNTWFKVDGLCLKDSSHQLAEQKNEFLGRIQALLLL